MKKYVLVALLIVFVLACNSRQDENKASKNEINSVEIDTIDLITEVAESTPILDTIAIPQQSFIEKYAGTAWTNGSDTITFKTLSGELTGWDDIIGPKMWHLYKVDGPFYGLPCEDCYTGNECHMCGYNAVEFFKESIVLFWDYRNDFFAEKEGVRFSKKEDGSIASVIFRSGYFEEYESAEIKWVSINSALLLTEEEINSNKKAQEDFENKKALEMTEAEKEIFDDYSEGPHGIAGEIYFANDGDVVKIEPDTYYEVLHLEDLQNLTLDFTGVELLTKEDVTIFTLENCSNIKIIGLTIRHDIIGCFTNCFDVNNCDNISFIDCDINGSGFIGICVNKSTGVEVERCKIHNCEMGTFLWENNEARSHGIPATSSDITFRECTFNDNNVGNICFDHNYAKKINFKVVLDSEEFLVSPNNYKNYLINYNYIIH